MIIKGTNNADILFGAAGDDWIEGGGGDDWLNGNGGNDFIQGGSGHDVVTVGAGNTGTDWINGGTGADTVSYAAASDRIYVDLAQHEGEIGKYGAILGTQFLYEVENVTGSEHFDFILGNDGANVLIGLGGADWLYGKAGNDTLDGGASDDQLTGGQGGDTLIGGAGRDTVYYDKSAAGVTVHLDVGTASGGEANGDSLSGIEDAVGSAWDDTLSGSAFNNYLGGLDGDDWLLGQGGADQLDGRKGADLLNGGDGRDVAVYHVSQAGVTVDLSTGKGTGGDAEGDFLQKIEDLVGSSFSDSLTGGAGDNSIEGRFGADKLWGLDGNDKLLGGEGTDTLRGGEGNDVITGGAGRDVMVGGADYDRFVFDALADFGNTAATRDAITGFEADFDHIDLRAIDANSLVAGKQWFDLIDGNSFGHTAGELRFFAEGGKTIIAGDLDGDGAGDFQIQINGLPALDWSNFILFDL